MRKIWMGVLAGIMMLALSGCIPDGLPPGDRDEIGLDVVEEDAPEPARPVGSINAASAHPVAVGSGFEAGDTPVFVRRGEAAGTGGSVAGMAETDGLLWLDRNGGSWLDCEAWNEAAGEEIIRETADGRLYFRYVRLDESAWVWDLDGPRLLVRLDAVEEFGRIDGLDEDGLDLGIVPGDDMDYRDKPVLEGVLDAIQADRESRALVLDFSPRARYSYGSAIYVRTDGKAVDVEMIPQDPDGTVFDGRRAWHDRDGILLVDAGDGTALRYEPSE